MSAVTGSGAAEELRDVADAYWELTLESHPVFASMVGDHRFDDRVDDLSAEGAAHRRSRVGELRERALRIDGTALDAEDRATRSLLLGELDDQLASIDLRLVELMSDQMSGPHVGLLSSMAQLRAPTPEVAAMALERLRAVGTMLDQAADRFRAGLAAGRTPARLCVDRSLNTLDAYLASPLDNDPFVMLTGPADWDGETAWRDQLRERTRGEVRPAFTRLRAILADELLPAARPDERCGLGWLDDGDLLYATLARQHTTLHDADPREIHQIGLRELERLRGEYAELGQAVFGTSDQSVIFDRLRHDPALRYERGDELLQDAASLVEAATDAAPSWFGRVPSSACTVVPVPDFLAADAPGAYYYPPPQDRSRDGTYYVNTHKPSERTRYETAAIAFHEAVPGHHFQLGIAVDLDRLPRFRRMSWSATAFVEGWALYAERLADEMGLYRDELDRLGMLAGDSWRSCRLVVDTGMHALGWSRARAAEFLAANAPVADEEVAIEIDRYVAIPGQALGYKIGQLEIDRLRRDATQRLGARFDPRRFHDTVIGSATVTLPVLRDLVDEWVGDAA